MQVTIQLGVVNLWLVLLSLLTILYEIRLPVLEEKVLPFVSEYFQAMERVSGRGVYLLLLGTWQPTTALTQHMFGPFWLPLDLLCVGM